MKQLVPFVTIGIGCAILDFGITYPLDEYFGVQRELAKAVGWVFGTTAAYLLNSRFAFKANVDAKKAGAVFFLYAVTFAVQLGLYRLTDSPLAALGFTNPLKDVIAFIIAQGVATVTNFELQRHVIFKGETRVVDKQEPPMAGGNPPVPPASVA